MLRLIIGRELRELIASRRFVVTFAVVALLIVFAFGLAASHHRASRARYQAAVAEDLRQLEGLTDWLAVSPTVHLPPQPLASLVTGVANDLGRHIPIGRGSLCAEDSRYSEDPLLALTRFLDLEFIVQVVLSLFAILFAFDAVSGEKERGTLRLVFSGAVPRDTYILGKLLGNLLGLTVPLLLPILMGCLVLIVAGVPMAGSDWLRLALVVLASLLYVGAFLGLSLLVSSRTHRASSSFVVLLMLWIVSVLIVPRGAVLLAARAVEVPSVDQGMSQRARLQRQLWREDREAIDRFLSQALDQTEGERDAESVAVVQGRINTFLQERREQRKAQVDALDARLAEERGNRQALQEELAFALARVSPAAVYSLAATNLAGTYLTLQRHDLEQARAYQETFERFQKEKTGGQSGGGGVRIVMRAAGEEDPQEDPAIDPHELPAFQYRPPPLAATLRAAVLDLGLLALFNLLFFAGAFVSFLRYDVR